MIYAVVDFELIESYRIYLPDYIHFLNSLEVKLIQYRDKTSALSKKIERLQRIKKIANAPVIVNDDLRLLNLADGIHLGQEDLKAIDSEPLRAAKLVRALAKEKLFGLSTHNTHEIIVANSMPLDYIGLGAYRGTTTKKVDHILGTTASSLASISAHQVALIGGVTRQDSVKNIHYYAIASDLIRAYRD